MAYNYSFQGYDTNSMVRASLRNENISFKVAYEISRYIRNRYVDNAIALLELVRAKKRAVPYRRFNTKTAHKPGTGPGRYPNSASAEIIRALRALKSHAQSKGFDTTKLKIVHSAAQKSFHRPKGHRRQASKKNAHFELVAKEVETVVKEKIVKPKSNSNPAVKGEGAK